MISTYFKGIHGTRALCKSAATSVQFTRPPKHNCYQNIICKSKLIILSQYIISLKYNIFEITYLGSSCMRNPDLIKQIQLVEMATVHSTDKFPACSSKKITLVARLVLVHNNQVLTTQLWCHLMTCMPHY